MDWYALIVLTMLLSWQCPWICPSLRANSQTGSSGCWKETQNYSSQRKCDSYYSYQRKCDSYYSSQRKYDSCDFIRGVSCHTTLWKRKRRRRKAVAYDILVYLG